jgi:hypothetical protein
MESRDYPHLLELADQLRAAQSPLKEQYRKDPPSAVLTLRAIGALGEGVSCNVETGRALVEAGLHPATGGTRRCNGRCRRDRLDAR